jgi:hypothetical protein
MRTSRVGLLLVLIPTIGSAAFLIADAAQRNAPPPAPKVIEAPPSSPDESAGDSQSQAPPQQPSDGEVIGIPLLA